jgi:dTDP-4-amino-4,6-dideoxygalactose transaminase
MEIPFLSLKAINEKYEDLLKGAFENFLNSSSYILGNNVKSFETNFANYCEAKYCIGVANGLDALILILNSFNFPKKSEIIAPANTYFASILAIKKAGYKPVLVEPNICDYIIDAENIIKKITNNTVAIMAVNLYGRMCDYQKLNEICKSNNLKLIVDAAQSHGAEYKNSKDCYGADAIAYSFYPTKNLGALSDAGAIITNSKEIANDGLRNRNYGSEVKYQFDSIGRNSRLSELQAAFLDIKLKHLDQEIARRREIAHRYLGEIKNKKLILPPSDKINQDAWHLFVVRTDNRDSLVSFLKDKQIGFDIHYPIPPHKQKALIEFKDSDLPITETIHKTILSLPLNSTLKEKEVDYIITSLNSY